MENWLKLEEDNFIDSIDCQDLCGILIEESDELSEESLQNIRHWLRHCYEDTKIVEELIKLGYFNNVEDYYKNTKFPSINNLRQKSGDFGESLAHFIISTHPNLKFYIPTYKLRSKSEKERALFGIDLIGFKFEEDDGENVLCISEIKSRITEDKRVLVDGCKQLSKEIDRGREIQQVARMAEILIKEKNIEATNKLARFAMGNAQQDFERKFVFLGLIDDTQSLEETISKLIDNTELCDLLKTKDFNFLLLPIKNYREKLLKTYE